MLATTDPAAFSLKKILFRCYKTIKSFLNTIGQRKTTKIVYLQGHYYPFGEMGYTSRSIKANKQVP